MSTYILRKGVAGLRDLYDGNIAYAASLAAGAKTVFYCDGNFGSDSNDGKGGWDNAFKTLTVALAASHADISSGAEGWAARNVIFCKGDAFDEDLVLFAQKTDVVGVGSYDAFPYCGLIGNHIPTGTTASFGSRFFNFRFKANAAGGDIFTLDSYNAFTSFHHCMFDSTSTTAATAGIVATAATKLHVEDCWFVGAFSDAVIEFGAGDARGARILRNFIEGANQGIDINASTTDSAGATQSSILIADNVIRTATECINDGADIAMIINNNCVTAAAKGTGGAGAIVGNELLSSGNKISASNLANADWPALGSL
ncbi:MAG: hypothetical protein KKD00_12585 [Gammaproteobacteria bacterium]|nr:hypothetical protein [Gammaproteobacteria bacterium]